MDDFHIERCTEQHISGLCTLYNDPAVARQVLQMPYQAPDLWRKRLVLDDERRVTLMAMHQDQVIGSASIEQFPRVRRSHCGSIGMGVAVAWQGAASARGCWPSCWRLRTTGWPCAASS